jgi:tetratricopeptide (TPR) repeat protein
MTAHSSVRVQAETPWHASEVVMTFKRATAHLQAGRWQDALGELKTLSPSQVNNASVCRFVGSVLLGSDGTQLAFGWFERAHHLSPHDADAAAAYATVLFQTGRLEEALSVYDIALRARWADATIHYNRGLILRTLGRIEEAVTAFDQALKIDPSNPEIFRAGGLLLRDADRLEQALSFFEQALKLRPKFYECRLDHADLLQRLGRFEEAVAAYDQAIALFPDDPDLFNNRGAALCELGQLDAAREAYEAALAVRPACPEALFNRGTILLKQQQPQAALASYESALALQPIHADAHVGRGVALKELGRFDEALKAFDTALTQEPDSPHAKNNKGGLQLLLGEFAAGLDNYEYRWLTAGIHKKKLEFPIPEWGGPGRAGMHVLVYDEQGFGDTFQFCRYLPMMAEAGVKVTFFCRSKLCRLVSKIDPRVRVVDYFGPEEVFDAQIALSSLPRAFGTRVDSIPSKRTYLTIDPDHVARWRDRLGSHGFKIGLCWQGNANPQADPYRSIPLEVFAPLAALPGVRLISLQKGDFATPAAAKSLSMQIMADLDIGQDSFFDTAAMMRNLDLVITCDTSIAHLAGALGCPVFVLLKQIADWRWLRDREDSPWYPTMRLFRQKSRGNWAGVVSEVSAALRSQGSLT